MQVQPANQTAANSWHATLDETERLRAARFVFDRHRVTYVAAHALTRAVLSLLIPDVPPGIWRLVAAANGKPAAFAGAHEARVSFNLSHADGIVGLAVTAESGHSIGFDLEPLDRRVTLDVAERYFCPPEVAWLASLPPAEQGAGFLRLWTLKESFIKATGEGLRRELSSFRFTLPPPRIHFNPTAPHDRSEDWHFEQRILDGAFVAAAAISNAASPPPILEWNEIDAVGLTGLLR